MASNVQVLVQDPAGPCPKQLPINGLGKAGGPSIWIPFPHMGDLGGVLSSRLQPGPPSAAAASLRPSQQIEESLHPSLLLTLPFNLIKNFKV